MPVLRQPNRDSIPESPIVYENIPLGAGQQDSPLGHLQFTKQGEAIFRTDVRRAPGYESVPVVHRPPHAPA